MKSIWIAMAILCLAGCASVNDAMTPSAHEQTDDFDGATIIRQAPVNAASSLSEAWHTLGFDWSSKSPASIYITVGVYGISNISAVQFNVDGRMIGSSRAVATSTDYASASSGNEWSQRRFSMPLSDFRALAAGNDIRMRVEMIDTYSVSKFGPANSGAIVNSKIGPFLAKVDAARHR